MFAIETLPFLHIFSLFFSALSCMRVSMDLRKFVPEISMLNFLDTKFDDNSLDFRGEYFEMFRFKGVIIT